MPKIDWTERLIYERIKQYSWDETMNLVRRCLAHLETIAVTDTEVAGDAK